MTKTSLIFGALAVTAAAGCAPDPRQYETTPVQIPSPEGTVTCQLYTVDVVLWDRAIDWPRSLTAAEADALCQAEGQRQKDAARGRTS